MDAKPNSDDSPTKTMEISPPIHLLPNELLVKIIEKLPRAQWPALELIDRKFRDATLLAWGSIRKVDMEQDFIYSESMVLKDDDYRERSRQIARMTEAILKKLSERSPCITSLIELALITDDPTLNTTAVQYLAGFEHLETITFSKKIYFWGQYVNGWQKEIKCEIPLINLAEFIESTQSRATLKEISVERCFRFRQHYVPPRVADSVRLRDAFANVSNDPTRQLLQLESFSMQSVIYRVNCLHSFFDNIDGSKMTKLSLGYSAIEPAVLTILINGAPQLRHIDFAFLQSCEVYDNTTPCQDRRLQPNKQLLAALESHQNLTSLGLNSIWYRHGYDCACHQFVAEFKQMLRTIGPQLTNFVFKPESLPPDIRMVEISDIIQYHMPSLKSITMDKCCAMYSKELGDIADDKELEEIEITSYHVDDACEDQWYYNECCNNTYDLRLNAVLSAVIDKSPRLKRFIGIEYYPDQRVAEKLCKLSDLVDLRVRADQLTKENFVAFSQIFAEKLEVLHLDHIKEGAESGLIELIRKATSLRELVVDRNVSDKLLECLGESCPNLEKFFSTAPWGPQITFDGVQMLVDRCPKLRWLAVKVMVDVYRSSLKNLKLDPYRKLEIKM